MHYRTALRLVHEILRPINYVEVGCQLGRSLSLSRCNSIAIDPEFLLQNSLTAPTRLFRKTSDDFFRKYDPRIMLGGPIDLSFIDGMHLSEFALRDFINLEKHSDVKSVIMVDDILPADIAFSTRERNTKAWTGDVYRLIGILKELRPDLQIRIYDVEIKGLALITNLNPRSPLLRTSYPEIEQQLIGERWMMRSVEEIRASFNPLPVEQLASDLWSLAHVRAGAEAFVAHDANGSAAISK